MKRVITLVFAIIIVLGFSNSMSANITGSSSGSYTTNYPYGVAYELNSYSMSSGTRRYKLYVSSPSYSPFSLTETFYGTGYIIRSKTFDYAGSVSSQYSLHSSDTLKIGAENGNTNTINATVGWSYNYSFS